MIKIITISPSGNLYGSENVLFDYLLTTELTHLVFAPKNSLFEKKIKEQNWNHKISCFNPKRLELFYLRIFFILFFYNVNTVYINEGGHVNWVKLLAVFFRKKKFVIHLRMVYDAKIERIGKKLSKNIELIAISDYVADDLKKNKLPVSVIYDGFECSNIESNVSYLNSVILNVGIIGRISESKGIMLLPQIMEYLRDRNEIDYFRFQLFGELMLKEKDAFINFCKTWKSNVFLHGFQSTTKIYKSVDIVLHLSHEEGLGRIFLEAICHKKPFIGFNTSGLKEIAYGTNLNDLMAEYQYNEERNAIAIAQKLIDCKNNFQSYCDAIDPEKMLYPFNLSSYSQKIDQLLK